MSTNNFVPNPMLEMLMSREQLMEDIDCIIESKYALLIDIDGIEHHTIDVDPEELVALLCDAVEKNFPAKWYPGQLPVENFYSTGQS